jgi:transcriptional regulator with XRE-family HTH domain
MANKPSTVSERALAIGHRIRAKRERIGNTQAELAAKVKITTGAIGQYETGKATPRFPTLERIALALQVSTGWLLHGDDPEERAKAQTAAELETLELIRQLPGPMQPVATAAIRGIVAQLKAEAEKN